MASLGSLTRLLRSKIPLVDPMIVEIPYSMLYLFVLSIANKHDVCIHISLRSPGKVKGASGMSVTKEDTYMVLSYGTHPVFRATIFTLSYT